MLIDNGMLIAELMVDVNSRPLVVVQALQQTLMALLSTAITYSCFGAGYNK